MPIRLQEVLKLDSPQNYKIHFAVWNRREQPLDVFVRSREDWSKWNSWRGKRDDFNRKYIFSLIRFYPQPSRWLFGGVFEVKQRRRTSNVVELCKLHKQYIGRLLVDYAGPGTRGRAFRLEAHYDKLVVSEIFDKEYSGELFCGYENVEHDFAILEPIFKQGRSDWKAALESVKGVYLIVDKSNGKMYVGSAYGDSGIWSRWACYMGTGHGRNDELTKLIRKQGKEYARNNFRFSVLEYRAMKTDDQVIIDREQYWKRVLLSGHFGYNRN